MAQLISHSKQNIGEHRQTAALNKVGNSLFLWDLITEGAACIHSLTNYLS